MPSNKTHDTITYVATFPIFILTFLNSDFSWSLAAITALSAIFSGFMFGPDLDIKSKQYYRWGVLRFLWIPYRKIFKHRSFFTHTPIIGTIIQLIYIGLILYALLFIATYTLSTLDIYHLEVKGENFLSFCDTFFIKYREEIFYTLVGLILGSFLHICADLTVSYYKKFIRIL